MDEFLGLLAVLIPLIIMLFEKKTAKAKGKKGGKGREETVVTEHEASATRPDTFPGEENLSEPVPVSMDNTMRDVPVGETLAIAQRADDILSGEEGKVEGKVDGLQGGFSLRDAVVHQTILERKYF